MKIIIRKINLLGFFLSMLLFVFACKKKDDTSSPAPTTTYSSIAEFYAANSVKSEHFTINAALGGNFTTAKGTKVTIPANAFVDLLGNPVTGTVNVEFKDIYSKSDMLLSNMPTVMANGQPLKSGGEFFIKVTKDTQGVMPDSGKAILIAQPLNNIPADSAMKPFVWGKGAGGGNGWSPSDDGLSFSPSGYLFSLYTFSNPVGNGTWCNSDNSTYFSAYTQTTLTIIPDVVPADYNMDVFLVFKGINSMVHVYMDGNAQFPYLFAPIGLPCTVVAVGHKDSKLYASYTDITISANQNVHVGLTETTDIAIKDKLATLNNN